MAEHMYFAEGSRVLPGFATKIGILALQRGHTVYLMRMVDHGEALVSDNSARAKASLDARGGLVLVPGTPDIGATTEMFVVEVVIGGDTAEETAANVAAFELEVRDVQDQFQRQEDAAWN